MIDLLVHAMREGLALRQVPIKVELGPDRFERHSPDRVLVIWRDNPTQAETVQPPIGAQGNPNSRGLRMLAATARFYLSSSLEGALVSDHERVTDAAVDAFLCALYEWAKASGLGAPGVAFGACGYVTAPGGVPAEAFPGVIYEMHFQIPRGVKDVPRDVFTITGISTTLQLLNPDGTKTTVPPVVTAPAPGPGPILAEGGLPTE